MAMKLKKFNNWDNFFKFSTGNRYPDNLLITLVLQEYKKITISRRKKIKILDLGFGAGASNLTFLCKENFDVYGIDISKLACLKAKKKLKKMKLNALIKRATFDSMPFNNSQFDMIIDCRSHQHIHKSKLEKSFLEIKRTLKPKGTFVSFFINYELNKSKFYTNYANEKYFKQIIKKNFKKYKFGFFDYSIFSIKKKEYKFWIVKAKNKY